jgi:hypothetical protein
VTPWHPSGRNRRNAVLGHASRGQRHSNIRFCFPCSMRAIQVKKRCL